jgi:hypothetical protein
MMGKGCADMHGFSPRNLKYMRAFAATWPNQAIVQAVLAQLPVLIDDPLKHDLYVETSGVEGWSER